ncbi:MAG: M48 family metallopeptidase [Flavobacteriaceae bacterium]|nr:M48 family metallopeptidase [Flavobacteriaceae bacterium]
MVKKIVLPGIIILIGFFGLFLVLSQVDFVSYFHVKEIRSSSENKIGDLIWEEISSTSDEISNDSITKTLHKLITPICDKNNIEKDSLKIHIVVNEDINAFALPDNHLVVFTGLIKECKNQEALQGVLGHEIAHIANNHVMKKLSKEIGLSVLLSATTGGKGSAIVKEILKSLSSSAYDRSLEKEADMASVDYLLKADINPEPFADFMFELAQQKDLSDSLYWISSHPESEERAKYILEYLKDKKYKKNPTISEINWDNYKKLVAEKTK